jgi:hypothetical protein
MEDGTRKALSDRDTWLKAPVLLLFYLLLILVTPVLVLVSVVGWFALLIRGQVPQEVSELGRNLAAWYGQTARYLTGGAKRRPFPFEDLDCPADEPNQPAPVAPKPRSTRNTVAESDNPVTAGKRSVDNEKPVEKKAVRKKSGKKKVAKKKTATKKASTRKSAAQKTAEAEITSESRPVTVREPNKDE